MPHLLEERLRRGRIGVDDLPCQLELDGERDEMLLSAIVEVALDPAAFGVTRCDHAFSRRAELLDFEAQLVERTVIHRRTFRTSKT